MKQKTTEEMLEEFFAKGGKVEKIPTVPQETHNKVNSTTKKIPELKTLVEGGFLYGEKKKSKKKKKVPDYSSINMDLIPENIKKLINYSEDKAEANKTMEDTLEANKNTRSFEADDKGSSK